MNTSDKSAHPMSLLPMLLLALWLITQAMAGAADVTLSGLHLPSISSYAPPIGAQGAKVYANLAIVTSSNGKRVNPTSIEFRTRLGLRVTSPVVMEGSDLFSFKVPGDAITGSPALLGPYGLRAENQPRFQVVSFTQTLRGVTVINMTQYMVDGVLNGSTPMLASGVSIVQGHAGFVSMTLSATQTPLDIALARVAPTGGLVPMLTIREFVGGGVGGTQIPAIQSTLTLERLTVAEILGAVNQSAEWKIFHRGQDRRMLVQSNGLAYLEERVNGQSRGLERYKLQEVSWSNNSATVQFTLLDAQGNAGETLVLHPPFDAFAANHLGRFSFEDSPTPFLTSGPSDGSAVSDVVPMFVRRVR